jgi:hypothetical protein
MFTTPKVATQAHHAPVVLASTAHVWHSRSTSTKRKPRRHPSKQNNASNDSRYFASHADQIDRQQPACRPAAAASSLPIVPKPLAVRFVNAWPTHLRDIGIATTASSVDVARVDGALALLPAGPMRRASPCGRCAPTRRRPPPWCSTWRRATLATWKSTWTRSNTPPSTRTPPSRRPPAVRSAASFGGVLVAAGAFVSMWPDALRAPANRYCACRIAARRRPRHCRRRRSTSTAASSAPTAAACCWSTLATSSARHCSAFAAHRPPPATERSVAAAAAAVC